MAGNVDRSPHFDIVLVSNGFQNEYEVGFANGLAGCGLRPALVCSDNLPLGRLADGVTAVNLRGSQRSDRSPWLKAANILRYWWALHITLRRQTARTVHVIGLFTLRKPVIDLIEAVAFRLAARRFVLTVHNLLPHDAHSRLNRWIFGLLYRLPHALVVHTERMREQLQQQFGIPAQRIIVMEHGIDRLLLREATDPGWLTRQLALPAGRPVMLFFGGIGLYKGLDQLADALLHAGLDDRQPMLVVAGSCHDPELRFILQRSLGQLVAQGRARWVDGFIPDDDVPAYFHGADVLVMPYRHIDQSGVLFMAISAGLPVVATDVGSLAHYVPLSGGRIVSRGDMAGLLDAVSDVVAADTDTQRRQRIGQAERFLWVNTSRAVLPAYQLRR